MSAASITAEVEGVGGGGGGGSACQCSDHTPHTASKKPLLKMMLTRACKQFAEVKQTKDMDYWNHVLWSDETNINLFGSDGVKRVWQQPGVQRQVCLAYSQAWWWECHGLGLHECCRHIL